MIIGVDVDDVLVNTMDALIVWHNRIYETKYKFGDVKNFNLAKLWGGDRKEVLEKWHKFLVSNEFRKMIPDPWSILAINDLSKNNDFLAITSRIELVRDCTLDFLKKHYCFEEILFSDFFIDKHLYKMKKSDICREKKVKVMVEDCLEYALECCDVVDLVYLINKPWNQSSKLPKNVRRSLSWRGIYHSIKKLKI